MANTPARVCPLAKKCGGCQLQNLSYDEQLHLKQATAIRLLGRFGHVEEIIGMKDPYHNRNDSDILSSFAARVLITLILELTWGILLFGLRGPAQRALIGKVNLATQIILNLGLCYGTLYLGPMLGNFLYFALEVLVFSVEAFVYNRYLPWPEGKKPHPILYALTANLLSFGIGLELNTHCTNTQIRLIGLVCLVLWYAGPWLCRKLRKVQNAQ